ncbi:diaminohydroxyphosphoribosylaminopyrimidine deaminase/5-amino-6-(5-phosphoribosylamino)uracil reductase [Pararhizobium capsulatum DSM 1112]|uniref:Riboflavin biosynthesis protein RibD n=1 Tax=Pararhizobium capsulatum DSM 1112 TaxID=1121113 RepID=A0ABU0BNL7_9HYPH|nr:bifunctional diaminohydroxyphosphoribosylaminopyrimidine deaminase/5-amino-6-(5-phosphoribosylamino)uracil reductase RibD [Pararhizobium capsulatum]MDQ0319843.1 diaminohydroxyphosphoribosylaminopyrimidine deaminase/5-amino-6-(5-phosphoribosylamino)uracil reductase [Pararhizobium capsulatum DSM 1112]
MTEWTRDDERFMGVALALAHRHLGQTATNPSVGCVIVRDDGDGPRIVGRAVTAVGGRPHAETQALAEAGDLARGATAYVTLEPCSHHGKTPPCADALIAAGVARVVIAVTDPDERVSGRGIDMLRDAGIVVETGLMQVEGERELEAYLMRKREGRPFVTLKLAVSADGMIGATGKGQLAITGPESRAEVHRIRSESDAILVGIGTAVADDPELTTRLPGLEHRSPIRIVLDKRLELPIGAKLVKTARQVPVIAVSDADVSSFSEQARRDALEAAGVEILICHQDDLSDLLGALATRGISSLLVEGGAKTAELFLNAGLVDRILLFTGTVTVGEGGVASPIDRMLVPVGFVYRASHSFGNDVLDEYEYERSS